MPKKLTAIRNICIVYHPEKKEALAAAADLVDWLKMAGIKTYSSPNQRAVKGTKKLQTKRELNSLDLVVVLGGDGTYLAAVRMLEGRETPILGVNMGALGFLTEVRLDDLYRVLELALKGKLGVRTRSKLEVVHKRKDRVVGHYRALNDIVIERGPSGRLLSMEVFSGTSLVTSLKADGLIIATPSGSTAYNLAAGGPIIHPDVPGVVITPICAHSLTNRPITLPDQHAITVKVAESSHRAMMVVDGQREQDVDDRDVIEIRKAPELHFMLHVPTVDYFDVLKTKLNFGERN